jgi:hypothetical protein
MGWRDDRYDDLDIDLRRPDAEPPPRRGSAVLGITSLILGIFSALLFLASLFSLGVARAAAGPGPPGPEENAIGLVALLFGVSVPILAVVGLVLGIIGAFVSNHTGMICSIVGIVLNAVILVVILVFTCLGVGLVALTCFFLLALVGAMNNNPQGPPGRRPRN